MPSHITTSGNLLSAHFIEALRQPAASHPGTKPESFGLPGRAAPTPAELDATIATAYELLVEQWDAIHAEVRGMDVGALRRRWLAHLLDLLDFAPVFQRGDTVLNEGGRDEMRFDLSYRGWDEADMAGFSPPVIHSVAPQQGLDAKMAGRGRGPKSKSPHDMVQLFLNVSPDQRWAIVSNGLELRLLRDYHHTSVRGYVGFDLESLFETRDFGDFRALYRLCHASRFLPGADDGEEDDGRQTMDDGEEDDGRQTMDDEGAGEEDVIASSPPVSAPTMWLERFYQDSQAAGIKVGDDLRGQVRNAIETLANGFIDGPTLARMQADPALAVDFYAELLHVIYRVLFLLYAEQRSLLPRHGAPLADLYRESYSITALRERALSTAIPEADPHSDLWEGLKVTFAMMAKGAPDLGVYAYNGMLFDPAQTPMLDGVGAQDLAPLHCRNNALLAALRSLTAITREGSLQRISYADLGVEELGSVYESLLDYRPRLSAGPERVEERDIPANTFFLDPRGAERKTTGSHYTPSSLVNELIRSALLPVVRARVAGAGLAVEPEAGTNGVLGDYEGLSEGQRQAGAAAILGLTVCDSAMGSGHFLVAANNALGLELARLRVGDAYPPEAAVQAARRDVLTHCIYGVDLNPMAVELAKVSLWINAAAADRPLSFLDHHLKCGNSLLGATPDLLEAGIPDDAFKPVSGDERAIATATRQRNRQERAAWKEYRVGYRQQDLWAVTEVREAAGESANWRGLNDLAGEDPTAARTQYRRWVEDELHQLDQFAADLWTAAFLWPLQADAPPPPTEADFRRAREDGPRAVTPEQADMVESLRRRHRFFHWHLEFPDIFPSSVHGGGREGVGFDVVLGNPPWDILQIDSVGEMTEAEFANVQEWFKQGHYEVVGGRRDLYKLFIVLTRHILSSEGNAGLLVPVGMFMEDKSAGLRHTLFFEGSVPRLAHYQNTRKSFFDKVHASYRFVGITYTPITNICHTFTTVIRSPADVGSESLIKVPRLTANEILGTDFYALLVPSIEYYELHQSLMKRVSLLEGIEFELVAEFHATSDKALTSGKQRNNTDWQVLKNRSVHQFNDQFAEPSRFIPEDTVRRRCLDKGIDPDLWMSSHRLLIRDIARNDDTRTLIACLASPGYVSSYDTPMVVPPNVTDLQVLQSTLYFLAGVLNSFVFDFLIRPFVDKHIKGYVLKRLPLPRFDLADINHQAIANSARELSAMLSEKGAVNSFLLPDALELRASIDATVAHLLRMSEHELDYVLDSFPKIRSEQEKALGSYRSQDLTLTHLKKLNS